jgi:hypothetical protein
MVQFLEWSAYFNIDSNESRLSQEAGDRVKRVNLGKAKRN